MKPEILRIKSALAGPSATSPTSRMVKCQDHRLWAYGGAFCLSVPVASAMQCGFYPDKFLQFFSVEREGCSITEQDGIVVLKHGATSISITQVRPAHEIPSLAAIGPRQEIEPLEFLTELGKVCPANCNSFHSAVHFRDGMVYAVWEAGTFSVNGLSVSHPDFCIPAEACVALGAVKGKMTHFILDQGAAQFEFDDGTILAARRLMHILPQVGLTFEGEEESVALVKGAVDEILNFRLKETLDDGTTLDGVWEFREGSVYFSTPKNETTGVLEDVYIGPEGPFRIAGESLRRVLEMTDDIHLLTVPGQEEPNRMIGYGDGFAIVSMLRR